MWKGFDGRSYSKEQFAKRLGELTIGPWVKYIVLHNTGAPTLKQWAESGPAHDARVKNLQYYYEKELGWHAGPHLFISRQNITIFSDLTAPGVHASCFNSHSLGIEMVGDFGSEDFNSGDGALVRDMTVFALSSLHKKLWLRPDGFIYNVQGLHFHRDCVKDHHACPGKTVGRDDVVNRVLVAMALRPLLAEPTRGRINPYDILAVQKGFNRLGQKPLLKEDGLMGEKTKLAVEEFQLAKGLRVDGDPGPMTVARLSDLLEDQI